MKKLCVFVLMLLVVATTMFAQEKPNVVIAPFKPVGDVTESDATAATELFTSQMVMQSKFRVIEHRDLDSVIDELHFQLSDWSSDSNKVQAVGNAVNAQYIVRGQLMKLGNQFFLSTTLLKIEGFEVVAASQDEFNYLGDILSVIPGMVKTMTEKIVPTVVKKTVDPIVGMWQADSLGGGGILIIEFFEDNKLQVHQWDYYDEDTVWWGNQQHTMSGEGYWEYYNSELKLDFNFYSSRFSKMQRIVGYQFTNGNQGLKLDTPLKIGGRTRYSQFYRIR